MTERFEKQLRDIETNHLEIYGPLLRMIDYEHDEWIYHFELRERKGYQYLRLGCSDGMEHIARVTDLELPIFINEAMEKTVERVSKMSWVQHGTLDKTNRSTINGAS